MGTAKTKLSTIRQALEESARVKRQLAETSAEPIQRAAEYVIEALEKGGKVLLCGNGGSASDSQHIAAELVGRFQEHRRGMPAIALTTDTSILTSVSNDYGFEEVFRRQVEALGKAGDVLVGISTSARSQNVVLALKQAKQMGMRRIALTGQSEGPLWDMAEVVIPVPSGVTARIQEGHIAIGHILCDLAEKALLGKEASV